MARNISFLILLVGFLFLSCQLGYGEEFKNKRSLQNLSSVKVYYDVKTKNPDKLELQLTLINATYQQLAKEGIKAEFVLGFRNQASNFVTKSDDYVFDDDMAVKKKIQEWVRRFSALGVFMEQCLISATFLDIDPEDFLPQIKVIKNSYISMIGYQTKGYAQITME